MKERILNGIEEQDQFGKFVSYVYGIRYEGYFLGWNDSGKFGRVFPYQANSFYAMNCECNMGLVYFI